MASITLRGKRYEAQVRTKGFKPTSKTFNLKSEAKRWATEIEAQQAKGVFIDTSEASSVSFSECLDRYEREQLNRRAFASLKTQLSQLRVSNLIHLSLANVTPKLLTQYRDDRVATGIKAATCIRDLGMLHALFVHIQKEWHITLPQGNPLDLVSKPKHTSPTSRDRRLVDDEEERILNYLDDHSDQAGLIVRFALATGMRRGEILNVEFGHILLDRRVIHIPVTKTDNPRTIPMPNGVQSYVRWRTRDIVREEGEDAIASSRLLFNMKPASVTQAFGRACKVLDIKGVTFHTLRHEAISRMFEKGLDMMEVSSISGHKGFDMLKKYTHLRPENLLDKPNKN